jgi:hypothetical protein
LFSSISLCISLPGNLSAFPMCIDKIIKQGEIGEFSDLATLRQIAPEVMATCSAGTITLL